MIIAGDREHFIMLEDLLLLFKARELVNKRVFICYVPSWLCPIHRVGKTCTAVLIKL